VTLKYLKIAYLVWNFTDRVFGYKRSDQLEITEDIIPDNTRSISEREFFYKTE